MADRAPSKLQLVVVLLSAVAAISLSSIFARLAEAPGVVVAFWRMALSMVLVIPFTVRGLRRTPPTARTLRPALWAGVLLGVHFAAFLSSLAYTTVAASVTLVTTVPLWVALIEWARGRRPRRGVIVGLAIAIVGGAAIGLGDLRGGSAPLLGDALALLGAVTVAGYFLLGRHAQHAGLSIGAYAGIAYAVAAAVLLPLPLIVGAPYLDWPAATWLWILLMALAPQLIGHTGLNWANRHLDPTLVATVTLLEPIGAGLLALALFGEVPGLLVLMGAPVLLLGIALVVRNRRAGPAPQTAPETAAEPAAEHPGGAKKKRNLL